MLFLSLLRDQYTSFVHSPIYGRETISINDVKTEIFSEPIWKKFKDIGHDITNDSVSSNGLFITGQGEHHQGKKKKKNKDRGKFLSKNPYERGSSKAKDKNDYCLREGHWVKDCLQ